LNIANDQLDFHIR